MIEGVLGLRTDGYNANLRGAMEETRKFKTGAEREIQGLGGVLNNIFAKFGGGGGIAGAMGLAGLGVWLGNGAKAAGDLQDKVDMLGVSAERLQGINDVLADAGVAPEVAEQALVNLNSRMIEAIDGSDQMRQTFERLGVPLGMLVENADAVDEVFLRVADGFQAASDKGRALKDLETVLGRPGKKIAGAFKEGSAPIREAEKGLVITGKEAESVDKLLERVAKLKRKLVETIPGKAAGSAAQVAEVLFDPEQWKRNLLGQNGMKAQQDEFARLTPDERRRIGMGISPDQARALSKTRFHKPSQQEEIARQQEHETIHGMQDAEAKAGTLRDSIIEGWVKKTDRRAAGLLLRKQIAEKAASIEGMAPDTAAQARAELAGMMSERFDQLREEAAMTPKERHDALIDRNRQKRISSKAMRALQREGRKELAEKVPVKPGGEKPPGARDPLEGVMNDVKSAVENMERILDNRLKFPKP